MGSIPTVNERPIFYQYGPCDSSIIIIALVASFSVGFGSKERTGNGIFGVLPAQKTGRGSSPTPWKL